MGESNQRVTQRNSEIRSASKKLDKQKKMCYTYIATEKYRCFFALLFHANTV